VHSNNNPLSCKCIYGTSSYSSSSVSVAHFSPVSPNIHVFVMRCNLLHEWNQLTFVLYILLYPKYKYISRMFSQISIMQTNTTLQVEHHIILSPDQSQQQQHSLLLFLILRYTSFTPNNITNITIHIYSYNSTLHI